MRKMAVVGSRGIAMDYGLGTLEDFLVDISQPFLGLDVNMVVSGGAKGADAVAEQWAKKYNFPITVFEPDWEKHGKAAGFVRNAQIADYGDFCVALWDGKSKGTRNTIDLFLDRGKPVHVLIIPLAEEV
jgi:hypothetical protein